MRRNIVLLNIVFLKFLFIQKDNKSAVKQNVTRLGTKIKFLMKPESKECINDIWTEYKLSTCRALFSSLVFRIYLAYEMQFNTGEEVMWNENVCLRQCLKIRKLKINPEINQADKIKGEN